MDTKYIIGAVVGACVAITGLAVWSNIKLYSEVSKNSADIATIVQFINQATQQAQ